MKDSVIIKSYPNGIALQLDENLNFEELYADIVEKFKDTRKFFKHSTIALDFEGRNLNDYEKYCVLQVIEEFTDLKIACIVVHDKKKENLFAKSLEVQHECNQMDFNGFFKGSLKKNQMIESDSSIIVLGDVQKGAMIVSTKNIIVLGSLFGDAYAGSNGSKNHFIIALNMSPEYLQIGDFRYYTDRQLFLMKDNKIRPQVAMVKDHTIAIDFITKESQKQISRFL